MGTKSALTTLVLIVTSLVSVPIAHANAPGLSDYVWNEPALGFKDCMERAPSALQQLGVLDVKQSVPSDGLGFVGGEMGDYYLGVICISAKGLVVTQGAGPDFNTADRYRQQIDDQMKLGSR